VTQPERDPVTGRKVYPPAPEPVKRLFSPDGSRRSLRLALQSDKDPAMQGLAQYKATGTIGEAYLLGYNDTASLSPRSRAALQTDPVDTRSKNLGILPVHQDPRVPRTLKKGYKRIQSRIDQWVPKDKEVKVRCQSRNIWSFGDETLKTLCRKVGALRISATVVPELRMELHERIKTMVYDSLIIADATPMRVARDGEMKMPTVQAKHVKAMLEHLGLPIWMPTEDAEVPQKKRRAPAKPWVWEDGGGVQPSDS
jgi:hypothetical protein